MQTLPELKEQIGLWSEREDIPDTQLDHFINLTEQEFKDDFFLPPNEKNSLLTTDADGKIAIPSDYLKTKHITIVDENGLVKPLYRKPNEFVQRAGSINSTNTIAYFERLGSHFIFAPAAGEGLEVSLTYYNLIPSLIDAYAVDPNQVNFVMSVMPTVYLFGALMFLHMYTFNEERASYYREMYTQAKKDLIGMQEEAEMSGSSLHVVPTMSDNGSTW